MTVQYYGMRLTAQVTHSHPIDDGFSWLWGLDDIVHLSEQRQKRGFFLGGSGSPLGGDPFKREWRVNPFPL